MVSFISNHPMIEHHNERGYMKNFGCYSVLLILPNDMILSAFWGIAHGLDTNVKTQEGDVFLHVALTPIKALRC